MYHLRKLKSLLLLLCFAVTAQAQLATGKVYNFVNVENTGKSMVLVSGDELSVTTTDQSEYKQLWYVVKNDDNSYSLRNLDNRKYLRSPNATGNQRWTVVETADANCKFECVQAGSGYSLRATNSSGNEHDKHYMHYSEPTNGVNRIVCWSTTPASQWIINEVPVSEKELEYSFALGDKSIYQTALSSLFTDNSCSELKPAYASYTKNQMMSNSYYLQLPSTLQKMVLKMCTDGTWQENNYDNSKEYWDATRAKKYRVQLYEPYNTLSAASTALSLNEHTNMNNPTGIFSGGREVIYVMVKGTIKDGSSLYLDSYTGHNKLGTDHKKGIQLTEGLNVILSETVGNNYFVNYVVETFDTSDGKRGHEAKARSLKDYEPLKIHIEGGYINGYYNKVGDALYGSGDKNADWEYIEARATQTDVTVLGKYMTLQFPLRDEDTEQYVDEKDGDKVKWHKGLGSYLNDLVNIEDVINSWDNVMMWERLLLGVLDENTVNAEAKQSPYSITDSKQVIEYTGNDQEFPTGYGDYYNIHGLAYGVGGSAYMYGAGDHSGYHYNTMGGIIQNIPTNAGSHWGPAHEIGHQHQNLLKIRKEMEVTNNLFSNVVLWYFGETTSRVNGTEGSLENILNNFNKEDGHYLTNNIWGMTQMYYKLFLYYHVLGHNPKFYPRLFEILRQDPSNGMAGTVDGEEAQLHIYKKMCQAAGEDLTEFFRAHGFLKPLDGFAIDDYGVSTFYMTQAQIDAAIAEVKSWNYKENVAVLFINDATGETIKSHKGDNLELYGETRVCAEVGGYASFEESITNAGDLEFTVSSKTVTVNKGGGVGYAIFNEKGEIIAFSDKKTFTVSDECATALMWGEATVKVVNADNSVVNVENVDEVASKYTLLGELITEADAELTYLDATNTKVGYYKEGALTALQTARDEAKVVYDNQDTQSYTVAYAKLSEEFYAVTHNDYNRVSVMAGGIYRLQSRNSSNWMSVNGENKVVGEASNESSTSQQWIFEAAGEDDTYYIKNASTSLYIGGAEKSKQVTTQAEAKAYKVVSVETGVWTLQCQDSNLQWLNHNGGSVLGWNDGNDHNSQWYITFKSVTQDAQKLHELKTLVQQTKELIDEMAEVTPTQKQTLQTTSSSSPFYLSTNACHNTLNGASDGQGLAGLLDEDAATFFHSDYNGHNVGTHYLQVDLGGVLNLSKYIFYYTTRDNGNNCPTTIEVWGSTDGTTFNDKLYTFDSGLPTEGKQTWESPMLTKATNYRSLRFMVTAAEGGNRFFVMSRFGIAKCEATVQNVGETYTAQGLTNDALISAYASIHNAQDKVKVGGFTSNELTSLYEGLLTKYDALETIYNNAANEALDVLRGKLRSLIGEVENLYKSCGSVEVIEAVAGTEVTGLQTTNSNGDYYVWTNAQSTQEGPISGLIDGLYGTGYTDKPYYFHSAYSGETITDGLKHHHITINLGTNNAVSAFKFQYRNRTDAGVGFPAEIAVYGSIDGSSYNKIITLNDMEKNSTTVYTSPVIETSKEYAYLRFMVTKSSGDKSYFHMAEFDLYVGTPSYYDVTLNGTHGEVDDDMMIATYDAIVAAQASVNIAATEAQLQKTINKLQAQYDVLYEAKNAAQYFTVKANIDGGGVRYDGGDPCTSILAVSASLTIEQLKEKLVAIELGGYVAQPISITDGVITVTYNKEYTVQVVGVDASAGGVKLGETTYNGGATFNMLESEFNIENFNAVSVEGYEADKTIEGSTITVTYKKIYTIQVVGVVGQGGVVFDNNNYTHDQELYALDLVIGNLAAMGVTGYVANVSLEGATITVTYNKIYTVQVVGLDGQGGVQFGDDSYNHGQELNALNLQVGNLTAIVPEGYVANVSIEGATITVTYKKIYTVNVSGVTDQGGVMLGGASYTDEVHVLGTLEVNQLSAVEVDGYKAFISVEGTTINVVYKMIYHVEVVGADGGVTFEGDDYARDAEVYALSAIEVSQLTAVEVSGYVGTVTLDDRTIRVAYCKLIQDLSELRNYKAYHIRAKSGEGYFAWNSSITDTYVSLRGATDWSKNPNGITSNETVANKYKEVVTLSDKTVAWQIIKEGDSYYLYQPEKKAYVTRNGRNYLFTADKTALDGIRQNSEDYVGTFGIHAGGDYSDGSSYFACIVINESEIAVRNWYYTDHGAILQIIENPYVYARDYAVEVVGNVEGRVEFEDVEYSHGESISATELLTASDLMVKSIGGYEHKIEVNKDNATITITYTAIDKTELINLITNTEALVNSASSHLGSSLNVTQGLIDATNEKLTAARNVRDNSSVNKEEYDATLAELQAAYARLNIAIAYANLPVQLTFDANNPVTYKITINRDGLPVLAYDSNSSMVAVTAFELGNKSHGWYFMATTDGKVRIMPYHELNTTLALSTNSFAGGADKVIGKDVDTEGYTQEWTISNTNMSEANRNAGWYNITTINPSNTETTWYFSNHGGVSNKMGFYNDPNDNGSRFKFEQISFDKSAAYYTLYNYYHGETKVSGTITGGAGVGYYPETEAEAYNTAYSNATTKLESTTATDEEYTNAYNALKTANEDENFTINMPVEGRFYRFVSAHTKDGDSYHANGTYVYANPADNKMRWGTKSTNDATAMWTIVPSANGKFAVENLHTGSSIKTFVSNVPTPLSETAGEVSIVSLSADGQVGIKCGGSMMHAQSDNAIVTWSTNADGASAWRIVEVAEKDLSDINFALTIGQYRHASLYLNYATKIPAGVKVFVAHTPNGDTGEIIAEELIDATVLPAKTAVIVQGDAATYNFTYTTDEYDGADEKLLENNRLGGSAYLKYQQVEKEGNRCCVFGRRGNKVGLYKNYIEYIDANGSQSRTVGEGESATTESFVDTDDGTHFEILANKIYFEYNPNAVANASAFHFRFYNKGEGTTTIDELIFGGDSIIYNLYGQRIMKIIEPGVYIVDGKKIYVSEKMILNND